MKIIAIILIILLSIGIVFFYGYKNIEPSAMSEDIYITSKIKLNNTNRNTHKKYILELQVIKKKDAHSWIYPYIDGLYGMSFSSEKKYYIPGSIGTDYYTQNIALNTLKKNYNIKNNRYDDLLGFALPYKSGEYNMTLYFDESTKFTNFDNPSLVYIHAEKKFGKELSWAKIVKVTVE